MPVINGEASYEMLFDKIPAQWPRAMFWICMLNGAAGHTYGANGIWQCNRRDAPHGPSPNGAKDSVGYGKISWDEAMNLDGSRQIGLGKKLLKQYTWQHFTPHPEWAAFTNQLPTALDVPQSAGIPSVVRIIWVPRSEPILVRDLEREAGWDAAYFDPATGARKKSMDQVQIDPSGVWPCDPPSQSDHDWVLLLEAKNKSERKAPVQTQPGRQASIAPPTAR
jgi:hypothetical protein